MRDEILWKKLNFNLIYFGFKVCGRNLFGYKTKRKSGFWLRN